MNLNQKIEELKKLELDLDGRAGLPIFPEVFENTDFFISMITTTHYGKPILNKMTCTESSKLKPVIYKGEVVGYIYTPDDRVQVINLVEFS